MDPCYNPVKVNGSMNGGRVTGLKVGEGYGFGNRTANLVRGSIVTMHEAGAAHNATHCCNNPQSSK
jgi:hypothetical protein